jgi:bile acid-coenzyme A ligase
MALMPIGAAIRFLAERDPGRPAITIYPVPGVDVPRRTITRIELDLHTNKLARTFERRGVKEGDFVTIGLPNSIEFYEACIATWKLGAVPQPISHRLPERERQEIIDLVQPSLVVTSVIDADPDANDEPLLPDRTSPYYKAPTSGGSTGRPKIIVAGNPGLADPEGPGTFGGQPDGVQLVPGPLYHNGPFVFSMGGLFIGSHLVVLPRFDAATALQAIEELSVDFAMLVPTMMTRMLKLPDRERYDLSSLSGILHLAAPCPPHVKEGWIDWIGADKVWELYAGTEAQGVTIISGTDWIAHRGTIGKPGEGTMKVLDADGTEVARGEVGEIWMKPPADRASYHYIGAEARRNAEGWESLGDMGWMDDDGYLYIADRRTDLILAGGANIYPAEVEAALEEHPAVLSCAVIGIPDDDLGQRVHALVQLSDDTVTDDDLRAFLAERLVAYKVPRSFERMDGPVRDDAGKVRRSALVEERSN